MSAVSHSAKVHQYPPTSANLRQPPPSANFRQPPPSANLRQYPPTSSDLRQPLPTSTNLCQPPPSSANLHQPPPTSTILHQPTPTSANLCQPLLCQLCQPLPTSANICQRRQRPPMSANDHQRPPRSTKSQGHFCLRPRIFDFAFNIKALQSCSPFWVPARISSPAGTLAISTTFTISSQDSSNLGPNDIHRSFRIFHNFMNSAIH
eukprot:Phypoly_transcript_11055.p1 GENE.Phypoly_transcript_11055~~Phypoly_transcript_11055.p1  ORF type:complete len:206 (+),score=22.67 Phypoly_transcript_11055:511-1128(+)